MPPQLAPHAIDSHLSALASIRLSLQIYSAEVSLLRSDFATCTDNINQLVATARKHDVWDKVAARVCLIQGMLHQAKGETQPAWDTLAAVESGRAGEDEGAQLGARLALLILGMSEKIAIRLDSTRAGQRSAGGGMELDEMARRFVEEAARGPPSWNLAGEFVRAMACGEITKSKQHLSDALKLANTLGANHARALMLALLGNLYLHTRNGEVSHLSPSFPRTPRATDHLHPPLPRTRRLKRCSTARCKSPKALDRARTGARPRRRRPTRRPAASGTTSWARPGWACGAGRSCWASTLRHFPLGRALGLRLLTISPVAYPQRRTRVRGTC